MPVLHTFSILPITQRIFPLFGGSAKKQNRSGWFLMETTCVSGIQKCFLHSAQIHRENALSDGIVRRTNIEMYFKAK